MNTLNKKVVSWKSRKLLPAICCLMGLGLLIWCGAAPAWGATITITFIDGLAAGGGTLYINHANNISLDGTKAGDSKTVHIEVDGVEVQTTVSGVGGDFNCNFNASDIDAAQVIRAWVVLPKYSNEQNIIVDTDAPDLPAIHWQAPVDGAYVGPNLSQIRAGVNDTGGSGIDWSTSTLVLSPAVANSNSNDGGNIYFNPTHGWPESDGSDIQDFSDNTIYTITAIIYDLAGNVRVNTAQFTLDYTAPNITTMHWHNPVNGPYVGPNLSEIQAVVSDAVSGIDWGNSTLVLGPGIVHTNSNVGGSIFFNPTNGWPESDGSDDKDFTHNTTYTITATIQDDAGNVSVNNSNSFTFDYVGPSITTVHWHNPVNGPYVGPNLSEIRAAVSDALSGVDWGNSTLVLGPGIAHSNSNAGGIIYFNPTGGWPESDGSDDKDFTHNTTYTITATIQDDAGNVSVNNTNSFTFDYVKPSITSVDWQNPVNGPYVGPNLSEIRAAVSDTLSGVDWGNSTLVLGPGIAHSNSNAGGIIYFNPTGGWPESDGSDDKDFTHNTTYTITATIQDDAGNVSVNNTNSFIFDYVRPSITTVHWHNPVNGEYVGPNLSEIRAAVSDALSGIDWGNSTLVLGPGIAHTNSNAGGSIYFNPTGGWPESDGLNDKDFTHDTLYTITATIQDDAGNVRVNNSNSFRFDYVDPIITDIHWQAPLDHTHVGPNLSDIWAPVSDALSDIDWGNSTLLLDNGVGGSNWNAGGNIHFTPNNNWPESDGSDSHDFADKTLYTVTAVIHDQAGNESTSAETFRFDYLRPTSVIHWEDTLDCDYVGPNLSSIWSIVGDPGPSESGIDWPRSTVIVSGIGGTNSNNLTNRIDFNPTNGWPESDGSNDKDFTHNIRYTVTANIYDTAENLYVFTRDFRFDYQNPGATIQWQNPHRGTSPPSYYMGEDLSRIWATLNATVTEDIDFGDAIDYSNTTISITPAPIAGGEIDGGHIIDWSIATPPDYHTRFVNGVFYSVTVVVQDLAGNNQTYARYFMKDEDPPSIGNIQLSNISAPAGLLNDDFPYNRVIRGTHLPLSSDYFVAEIIDTKGASNDWGGHTSLNGSDISYHWYEPSEIRLYHESAGYVNPGGTVNNYTADSGTTYRGFLTLPNTYSPISGVYSISVCARDWANYDNSHRDTDLPRFLVDDIPPVEDGVFPTQSTESPNAPYLYLSLNGDKYLRSYDLITEAPQKVSVYAHDEPFDRNDMFADCGFPHRVNLTASSVTLFNPDNDVYTMTPVTYTAVGWDRPYPDDTDAINIFEAAIAQTVPPIFPIPEYIGNTIEGRYTIRIHIEDTISDSCGDPNTRDVDYYFFNDLTPPRLISWNPFSTSPLPDTYSSNFPDVQAAIMEPDLRAPFSGGTVYPGSGLNLTACAVDIYAGLEKFWDKPEGVDYIQADGPFYGSQNQLLNDKQVSVFKVWDVDQQVGVDYGRKIFVCAATTTVASNGSIDVTGLTTNAACYVIGWQIPSTYSHDGICVAGSLPDTAVIKDGFYFANCFTADMVGNTAQVESIYFQYLSAGGLITLTADPHIVPADGVSEAVITTSPIKLSSHPGVLVQPGTLITVTSSLGDIITPDADSILDGIQVTTGSDGRAVFTVRSRAREAGIVTLRAKSASGFADSGEVTNQLEFVLSKMYGGRVAVKPAMEAMTAEYQIEAYVNSLNALVDGVDEITIQFPAGTGLPAAISAGNLLLNNMPVSGSNVTDRDLSFVVPMTMPKNSWFTVMLLEAAGIINPAAGHYALKIKSNQSYEFLEIPYDILISIRDEEMVPAPNPSSQGRVRFFFNRDGPARVELVILNLLGDKVSCVTERYGAAKKGEVLDWNTLQVGPGVYWALMKIHYDDGRTVSLKKRKVVIIK